MPSDRSLKVDSSFKRIPKSNGINVKALARLRLSGICVVQFIERNHCFFFSFGHSLVKKLKHTFFVAERGSPISGDLRKS